MMHKQHTMTMARPLPQFGSFRFHLREIVLNLKRLVEVPVGYQDENGFHMGAEPAKAEIQWPPA